MGSSSKIIHGFFWTTLFNFINGLYGFLSVPLLIAYFGKSNYGLIGLAMSVNVYLCLMDIGFNSTNVRFFSNWIAVGNLNGTKKLFQTSLTFYGLIGLLNAFILYIVSIYSEEIFHLSCEQDTILKHLFYILAISAFISWFTSCFDQLIKAHEYVGWIQKISLLPKIIQILILFLTIFFSFTIELYYALTVFSMFIVIPVSIVKIKSIAPYVSFIPKFDKLIFKEILPYSVNIFSFGLFQFSINYLRPVLLGVQGSIESVADYRILNGIISIVLMLGGSFMGVLLPSASRAVARADKKSQDRMAYDGTKYISIVLCFCCFGMMCVTNEVLILYIGESSLYLRVWLDIWLLTTLFAHNQAISSLILSGHNIKAITYCTIVSSIIGLMLCWFLISYYQVGGTVIAYGVYGILQLLFYYLYYWPVKMKLNSWYIFRSSFAPSVLIGFLSMFVVKYGVLIEIYYLPPFIRFLLGACIFTLLYCATVWKIGLNKFDKLFILNMIKR